MEPVSGCRGEVTIPSRGQSSLGSKQVGVKGIEVLNMHLQYHSCIRLTALKVIIIARMLYKHTSNNTTSSTMATLKQKVSKEQYIVVEEEQEQKRSCCFPDLFRYCGKIFRKIKSNNTTSSTMANLKQKVS